MHTSKGNSTDKSNSNVVAGNKKPATAGRTQTIQLNPVWHSIATNIGSETAAGAAADPPAIQAKSLHTIHIQRICTGCEKKHVPGQAGVQTKLTVGASNNEYEQEADTVAHNVMRMPNFALPLQRSYIGGDGYNGPGFIKANNLIGLQRQANSAGQSSESLAPVNIANVLSQAGQPLDRNVQQDMEGRFGNSFDHVRIHTDSTAAATAKNVDARAYTVGSKIVFGQGQYQPSTTGGQSLLAHELTHVIQQSGHRKGLSGVSRYMQPALQRAGFNIAGQTGPYLAQTIALGPISTIQRPTVFRAKVKPTLVKRKNRLQLIGDGTDAHPGITLGELYTYAEKQADWFIEPSLRRSDRTLIWNMLRTLDINRALLSAAKYIYMSRYTVLSKADRALFNVYVQGFDESAQTIRLLTPVKTMSKALDRGRTMSILKAFVPGPVLRVVIPESGLDYMMKEHKVDELISYYITFNPTLETPDEWRHVETLLEKKVMTNWKLLGWIADLHIFTPKTRAQLIANVDDKSRNRPVMLILFSATDWTAGLLRAESIENAVLNTSNLVLVLQGYPSLSAITEKVNEVADIYGEKDVLDFWNMITVRHGPGKLGQVVIVGHGRPSYVEMAVSSTAQISKNKKYVEYSGESLQSTVDTKKTQALIDTILKRMDPKAARIVFVGCLAASRQFPADMDLSDTATAAATLRKHIAKDKNLRDFVHARMAALNVEGKLLAPRSMMEASTFYVTPSGIAQYWPPAIGGSAEAYLQQAVGPVGALHAALETYADPKIGPQGTTELIKNRKKELKGKTKWGLTLTWASFELILPKSGDVNPAKILDLSNRVETWLDTGSIKTVNVLELANTVNTDEAAIVFPSMLNSNYGWLQHMAIVVQQAWMALDSTHVSKFATTLNESSLTCRGLLPLLAREIVNKHLSGLLPTKKSPTRGQMLLALTIAMQHGAAMPAEVRKFLRYATGGKVSSRFPASLKVDEIIGEDAQLQVLKDIRHAPGSTARYSSSLDPVTEEANIDLDRDPKMNERFIAIARRTAKVTAYVLRVRTRPSMRASTMKFLTKGSKVRVMGTIGYWSLIDADGKVGFVGSRYITAREEPMSMLPG